MAKPVAAQNRTAQVNTFTGGINTDLHPLLQPEDTLTDCVNGTLITYNGNENMLQNDMGNYKLKNANLPEGYIPMGMKEHQGVLYMILMNPITKKVQLGSYPSPQTIFEKGSNAEEYTISPVDIGTVTLDKDKSIEEFVWDNIENPKHAFTKLDLSKSTTIFTKDFHENSMLTWGDLYLLDKKLEPKDEAPFQSMQYFSIDADKNVTYIDKENVYDDAGNLDEYDNTDVDDFSHVVWNSKGWLGAQFKVDGANDIEQSVKGIIRSRTDKLKVVSYKKTSDINKTFIPGDGSALLGTYEFHIKGLNSTNTIYNLSDYLKTNTNEVYIKTDKSVYSDKIATKGYWSGGCYLEGEYDTPFYKYENKEMYPSLYAKEPDYKSFVSRQVENVAAVVVPTYVTDDWFSNFNVIDNISFIVYFTGDLSEFSAIAAFDAFSKKSNCTIIFADRCSDKFREIISGTYVTENGEAVTDQFAQATFANVDEVGIMTKDELNSLALNKCRLYFNTDIKQWGLHGTYKSAKWSKYTYSDQDWAPAIRSLTTYATDVIYPNREDLIILRTSCHNIVAHTIYDMITIKLGWRKAIHANSTVFAASCKDSTKSITLGDVGFPDGSPGSNEENAAIDYFELVHQEDESTEYWVPTSEEEYNKFVIKNGTNYLFKYQFPELALDYVTDNIEDPLKQMSRFVTDVRIERYGNDHKLILDVDFWGYVGYLVAPGEDINEHVKNAALAYLYKDFTFSTKYQVFTTDSYEGSLDTFTTFTIGTKETIPSLIKTDKIKAIVPESFDGYWMPVGTSKKVKMGISGGSKWFNQNKLVEYIFKDDSDGSPGYLQINITHNNDVNIATRITCDNSKEYKNGSAGKLDYKFNVVGNAMPTIVVESVPYRVDDAGHCLIYDDKKIITKINYFKNHQSSVTKYQYYFTENTLEDKEELVGTITVNLASSAAMNIKEVISSIRVYTVQDGVFIKSKKTSISSIPDSEQDQSSGDQNSESIKYGEDLKFNVDILEKLVDDFLFLHIDLDEDDSVILPLYTKLSQSTHDDYVTNKKVTDFTTLYIDELKSVNTELPQECVEIDKNSVSDNYITAVYSEEEEKLSILHESKHPYYWYNALKDSNSQSDSSVPPSTVYFGKARHEHAKINLTKLGIKEWDVISINGIPGKNYSNIIVTKHNSSLFTEKDNELYCILDFYAGYNLQSYSIDYNVGTPIAVRKYLINHGYHPVTHRDEDMGWTKDSPLFEHVGWNTYKPSSFKSLYVTKADAYNSNITLNVIDNTFSSFDADSESMTPGPVVTNRSQAEEKIFDMTGRDTTKQLFSLVKASITVDGSGLTIPLPRMPYGKYDYMYTKSKKDSGTKNAIVLTRGSSGLGWVNQLKNAIAYSMIAAGAAGIGVAIGFAISAALSAAAATTAAATAAATVATTAAIASATALAAVPFVGWAILAAAVIAASVYLLCKLTAGEDQEFEFFTIKGDEKHPLIIPLWGKHLGVTGRNEKVRAQWLTKNTLKMNAHPWYLDADFADVEELMTYIMTHVYYYVKGPKVALGSEGATYNQEAKAIELTIQSTSPTMFNVSKYLPIKELIVHTNNFDVLSSSTPTTYTYSPSASELNNNFDVQGQSVEYIKDSMLDTCYHDNKCYREGFVGECECPNEIKDEFSSFLQNLKCKYGDNGVNIWYQYSEDELDESSRVSTDQCAFGGNTGGCASRFKCLSTSDFSNGDRMITGEYPRNDQEYIPIAYGVHPNCGDKVMAKDLGWNEHGANWGTSTRQFWKAQGEGKDDIQTTGSKYLDYIHWDSYSNEFKLTVNTNEI